MTCRSKLRFACPHCGSTTMRGRSGTDDLQCGRAGCYRWSAGTAELVALPDRATDEKTVAERQWRAGLKPPAPQQPCDVGLFSDDANQKELFR